MKRGTIILIDNSVKLEKDSLGQDLLILIF